MPLDYEEKRRRKIFLLILGKAGEFHYRECLFLAQDLFPCMLWGKGCSSLEKDLHCLCFSIYCCCMHSTAVSMHSSQHTHNIYNMCKYRYVHILTQVKTHKYQLKIQIVMCIHIHIVVCCLDQYWYTLLYEVHS